MTYTARAATEPVYSGSVSPDVFKDLRADARRAAALYQSAIEQRQFARAFISHVVELFWKSVEPDVPCAKGPADVRRSLVKKGEKHLAARIATAAAQHAVGTAIYHIGAIYTVMLPVDYRSAFGVFYTPPALAERLIDQAEAAGVDWRTARVLDPACGGGAFLAPVASRMVTALRGREPDAVLAHIEAHLSGFEIDGFGAWMSHVCLEATVIGLCRAAGRRLAPLVEVRDSLMVDEAEITGRGGYDLVIGNPPYGKATLDKETRARWARSLYGHANVYGLFTDLAIRMARPGGVVAYVTPTGFLGGEYFKNLRKLLGVEAPPVSIDFVDARKGVFADALQETLLAVFRKRA